MYNLNTTHFMSSCAGLIGEKVLQLCMCEQKSVQLTCSTVSGRIPNHIQSTTHITAVFSFHSSTTGSCGTAAFHRDSSVRVSSKNYRFIYILTILAINHETFNVMSKHTGRQYNVSHVTYRQRKEN